MNTQERMATIPAGIRLPRRGVTVRWEEHKTHEGCTSTEQRGFHFSAEQCDLTYLGSRVKNPSQE